MASPSSTGSAGGLFESQVGAFYLLSMLAGGAPRGLAGTTIDRIAFQRADEGHHLDDVIILAHDVNGNVATLEIQVKRGLTFAPKDAVFREVVGQIAATCGKAGFWDTRYELGIAISRTSNKIDGSYQEVLSWARQIGDSATFRARINRTGSGNEDKRTFLDTFKAHLKDAGAPHDDESVWQLLRRIQILPFDFTAPGSSAAEVAKERAVRVLHPEESSRAESLWTTLTTFALQIAANGGDRTRKRLVEDLHAQSFRLAGDHRYALIRAALKESADIALDDIENKIGNVMLLRPDRTSAVRSALDEGRYVEIRGEPGVGKSGVLKIFAEQAASESSLIVLSPGRTPTKGWPAMRLALGFDGTAHELLSDLASDGSAILFIDNLDFFDKDERPTIIDLVREAAKIPSISIIATARQDFGTVEPSWLPNDAMESLGRTKIVNIDELNDDEIDELRTAEPKLKSLLIDDHPARPVARNLFRLARLVAQTSDDPVPRTETDMAEQWWKNADGINLDSTHRERARLLRFMAEHYLLSIEAVDVSTYPSPGIDALVKSRTLRDLGNDRVTFHHDVLREWAIANLLTTQPSFLNDLPMELPASPALARGIELAARLTLERSTDSNSWNTLLEAVSRKGAHGSWRRAALLSLVRSEIGLELLKRASPHLLENSATLLRELIRTVMAVDVTQAAKLYAAIGMPIEMIPANTDVPSKPSWPRLIGWILSLDENLPVEAIPDVVAFYTTWFMGSFGFDKFAPLILQHFYCWLVQIEDVRESDLCTWREAFDGKLDREQIHSLESDLRTGFLLFCNRAPALAIKYIENLNKKRHNNTAVQSILKFRGTLANAAPKELADFTVATLIGNSTEKQTRTRVDQAFGFIDSTFLPTSPNQGPFLELLACSPLNGLSLVRKLVEHAVAFWSDGAVDANAIIIQFPTGDRAFPWSQTYPWSRDKSARDYCVTSSLMALEAWAHRCIEELKEPFDKVLIDVLGPKDAPAAYLLLAVDLLISHWPASREAAIPFLACPELLCLDRERLVHDNFEYPDFFGLEALQQEPKGQSGRDVLKKRSSRKFSLDQLLGQYAIDSSDEARKKLMDLLNRAAERLGPPDTNSDLGDPSFMVLHALNLVNPVNWKKVPLSGDNSQTQWQYEAPISESEHLQPQKEAVRARIEDTQMQSALSIVLEDVSRSSADLAAAAVAWAQKDRVECEDNDADSHWMHEQAVLTAALIALRDGTSELRQTHVVWIRNTLNAALQTKEDPVHGLRSGLRYNPIAIAFVGTTYLLQHFQEKADIRALFEMAAKRIPAAAHGFMTTSSILASIDERLPRAILRCALTASIHPRLRERDLSEAEILVRNDKYHKRIKAAIDAEIAWLYSGRSEPAWPQFPCEPARPKRRLRLPGGQPSEGAPVKKVQPLELYTDYQSAARWINSATRLFEVAKRPWLRDIARTYALWTVVANGSELESNDDVDRPPREWNEIYFGFLAHCMPGLETSEIDELALGPLLSLPDESFFDTLTPFLRSVDDMYFNARGLEADKAVYIRSALVKRLTATWGWKRIKGERTTSIEMHIGPAIAVVLLNNHLMRIAECYLRPQGVDRLEPLLPILTEFIESGPCPFVALIALNLLEISPRQSHLTLIVAAANAWIATYPSDGMFWIDNAIGRRLCQCLENVLRLDLKQYGSHQTEINWLLAELVRIGVPEAHRLEEMIKAQFSE